METSVQTNDENLREHKRTEDYSYWPFHIPRELMDDILASPDLGVLEHLALAATCTSLRRIYHNPDIFEALIKYRPIPSDGQAQCGSGRRVAGDDAILRHLATDVAVKSPTPIVKGAYVPRLVEANAAHRAAIFYVRLRVRAFHSFESCQCELTLIIFQLITAEQAKTFYPNLTEEHLSHLKYYERGQHRFNSKEAGYMETAVNWLSIRVRNGWGIPGAT